MLDNFHIAAGDGGIVWFIFIVAVIISKIIKASKESSKSKSQPVSSGSSSKPYAAPEEELQKFLASLTGQTQSAPPPVPAPPKRVASPPAQPTQRPAAPVPVMKTPQVRRQPARAKPVAPPPPPLRGQRRTPVAASKPRPAVVRHDQKPHGAYDEECGVCLDEGIVKREDLILDLKGSHSLKKAIVLREVLGPPIALR